MRWPWSSKAEDRTEEKSPSWADPANATDWSRYRDPRNVVPVAILTGSTLLLSTFYRSYLKRIPQAINIAPSFWRKRSLFGRVTSVGDADNFRIFHTPGGRLAGWGWLPWRRVPKTSKELKDNTVRGKVCDLRGINPLMKRVSGSHSDRWNRCTRIGTLWPTCPALFKRGLRFPYVIHTTPTSKSLHLQKGSVRQGSRDCLRPEVASEERRWSADAQEGAGYCL